MKLQILPLAAMATLSLALPGASTIELSSTIDISLLAAPAFIARTPRNETPKIPTLPPNAVSSHHGPPTRRTPPTYDHEPGTSYLEWVDEDEVGSGLPATAPTPTPKAANKVRSDLTKPIVTGSKNKVPLHQVSSSAQALQRSVAGKPGAELDDVED